MKIIKHTFTIPSLKVVNGEVKEVGSKTETCTFTLLSKGIGLYEELADEPLMASLLKFNKDSEQDSVGQLLDKNFIKNLACASYVKIEGNAFHNNRKTCEEFKKKQFYEKINEDLDFIGELIEMASDCINDKKIANKAICLLLTLVLLLGVMPLAGLGTLRAKAANAGETAIMAADDADMAAATLRAAADLKELEFYSVDFTDNTSRFRVAPATITVADSRTKISEVAGTSDISTILAYGGAYKKPTVTVTTGAPAYFNINSGNGKWLKKNSAGDWDYYTGATFTEGTYKFDCQVRIDKPAGLTHMLDSAGVTVTVDGVAWTTGTPEVYDDYSLVGVNSPEYTVTSPSATTYTVTVTAGANMSTTGSTTQNVNIGAAMTEIIYTAADGYYFPTDYTVAAVNGITVTRIDFTKIKVSGTPTAAANITLTAPTAKTKEATPTAVFTANGTDSGKLTGIAAGMKYRINGGAWMNITATEANLTGLSACTITIMKSGNG